MRGLNKKILMIIAPVEFRDEEYREPRAVFETSGFKVDVASAIKGECVGKFGMRVTSNMKLNEVDMRNYSAVVFVGGRGSKDYWNNTLCHKIAKEAVSLGKVTAAICSAPVILANAGLLSGKKATCYPSDSSCIIEKGAVYRGAGIEVDGILVTADGPLAACEFGKAILKIIK